MKVIAHFEVPYYQFVNEQSQVVSELPEFAKNTEYLIHLYRLMRLNRIFDAKAISLQRTGKMGTYPSMRGQEAAFVGIGTAMAASDIFVPYYRDVAILTQRGVKFSDILLYWGGDERGNCFASAQHNFPYSVPVGSQPLHAAGVATALKIRHENQAVLVTCGDGATSQGDFYEAMNVAGVWKLPIVFVVINNQWAISVSREAQTASQTIAQKAIGAGFSGEQIDGNDVIAVQQRTHLALKKARENHQPTLLEIICYRQSDHTTADDASRYEVKQIREQEWTKEPIERLYHYLKNNHAWTDAQEKQLEADCKQQIEKMVEEYINTSSPLLESMFDYLYATLPDLYSEQREQLISLGVEHG